MSSRRVHRILGPSLALAAIAFGVLVLGLVLTGPAKAATQSSPTPSLFAAPGETRGAIVQFGEDVTVPAGESVESVTAGGGDIIIDGTVKGDVVAFGGDVLVRGTVENTIVAFGGDVRLAPTAVVGSSRSPRDKSIVLFGGTLTREPGAQVTGDVQRIDNANWGVPLGWVTQHTVIRPWWGFTLMGWIVQTSIFLVLALVAAALMPKQLRAVQRQLAVKPAASLGWGALTFFVILPAVLVVLIISIVGLLLVLPYMVVVPLFYFFVITAVAALIAARVLAGTQQKDNLMLAVTLGVVGTTIVSRVPVGGALALMVMAVFGSGAAALAFVEWRRARRPASAPALAPAGPALAAAASTVPLGSAITPAEPAATVAIAETVEPATVVTAPAPEPETAPAAGEPEAAEPPAAAAAPPAEGPPGEHEPPAGT